MPELGAGEANEIVFSAFIDQGTDQFVRLDFVALIIFS
jgi:hypothetical protein